MGLRLEQKHWSDNKLTVRLGRTDDLSTLFNFVDEYDGDLLIDCEKTKKSLQELLISEGIVIIEKDNVAICGIGGTVFGCTYNDEVMLCVMFLFVKKEYRRLTPRIILAVEHFFASTKINRIVYGFAVGKETQKRLRFMKILGYDNFDTHVSKKIRPTL